MSTVLLIAALWTLAVPGSSMFVSELYILLGAFQQQAVLGGVAACAIVLAAMYTLRWYSALAHGQNGERVSDDTPDLRRGELAIAVPLIADPARDHRVSVRRHEADRVLRGRLPGPGQGAAGLMHTIPVSFSAIGPEIILLGTAAVLLVSAIFLPDEAARRPAGGRHGDRARRRDDLLGGGLQRRRPGAV